MNASENCNAAKERASQRMMSEKLFLRHKITMPIQALASKQDTMEVMRKYVEVMSEQYLLFKKRNEDFFLYFL